MKTEKFATQQPEHECEARVLPLNDRRTLVIFNESDTIRHLIDCLDMHALELVIHCDEENTEAIISSVKGFLGLILGVEVSAKGKRAIESLLALCGSMEFVPPVLAVCDVSSQHIEHPTFCEILSLPFVVKLDVVHGCRDWAQRLESFFHRLPVSRSVLGMARSTFNGMWSSALHIYRHDRNNCLSRVREYADNHDLLELGRYLMQHGTGILKLLAASREDLYVQAEHCLIGNQEAIATIRQVTRDHDRALATLVNSPDYHTLRAFIHIADALSAQLLGPWEDLFPKDYTP